MKVNSSYHENNLMKWVFNEKGKAVAEGNDGCYSFVLRVL